MSEDTNKGSFTFSPPEEIHNASILDALGVFADMGGEYYYPPIDLSGLSMMRRANGHHGSCILFRRNYLSNAFIHTGALSIHDFRAAATDFLTFGNAYFQILRNLFGKPTGLEHIPALNMRVRTKKKGFRILKNDGSYTDYDPDDVLHVKEYDTQQNIYGIPDWSGGLQSALLNENATLFRRKYYINGAHMGYILYTNEAKMDPELVKQLKEKVAQGKGVGNFKTLSVHIPNGDKDAFQIISVGDISQKDEFLNVKNISAADVREAHRVPPVLMGVIPQGTSSLGDPMKIDGVYKANEVTAMAQNFRDLNEYLPKNLHFKFKNYEQAADTTAE